ncbi:MAG: J domain-containing protein, partial [Desulfobulbaceae bacterium]|nr:J domain-containing protein [Desulfobulbaceae bacterium]
MEEVIKIVALFQPSHQEGEDHHTTLGVSDDAGLNEIKPAYRTLSRRYHPDTASSSYRDNPEKFIAINKAYHALLSQDSNSEKEQYLHQNKQWRRKKTRSVSTEQRRKVFTWTLGLLIVFVVISAIASINYKKRAMLAGLQESRGAFIPPVRKVSGVSAGKEVNVEKQPTELPALTTDTIEKPKQKLVAKVQAEPKIEPLNVQLKEVPRKKFAKESATETIPNKEQQSVKQPGRTQPTRTREKMEVSLIAHAAPSSTLESIGDKETPDEGDNHYIEQRAGVKNKTEKTDGPVIDLAIEGKDATEIAAGAFEKASMPSAVSINHQPALLEQVNSFEPDVIFNTKAPAPDNIIAINTERKAKLKQVTATEITSLPVEFTQEKMHKQETPTMQTRLDYFFANYTKAYEQR